MVEDQRVTKALLVRAHLYLTDKQLAIFKKHHELKWAQHKIAAYYGISASSVSRTLKRAKLRIEKSWRKK